MKDLANIYRELGEHVLAAEEFKQVALELGAKPNGLNHQNAVSTVLKAARAYAAMVQEAEEMGTTLPNILKGARMRKGLGSVVPERYKYAPPQWIRKAKYVNERHSKDGLTRTFTRRDKGVSPAQAQYLRKQIEPLMIDFFTALRDSDWSLDERKTVLEGIDHSYFHDSYEDFNSLLHEWLLCLVTNDEIVEEQEEVNAYASLTDDEMMELCLAAAS